MKTLPEKFKLIIFTALLCFTAQLAEAQRSSNEKSSSVVVGPAPVNNEIKALESSAKRTFTFTGKGNWSNATNWKGNQLPPDVLLPGDCVVIDGAGASIFNFDHAFVIGKESSLIVKAGRQLHVNIGNFFCVSGGRVLNDGLLNIATGTLKQPARGGVITNNGKIDISGMAKSEAIILNKPVSKKQKN